MKFFGKSCDSITCDTCKYKEDCELINKFINDIKDKVYLQTNMLEV